MVPTLYELRFHEQALSPHRFTSVFKPLFGYPRFFPLRAHVPLRRQFIPSDATPPYLS